MRPTEGWADMTLTENVPTGAISRLTEHYGEDVSPWLAGAIQLIGDAAKAWNVRLLGFHDAGWTSIIAFGLDAAERTVVLKVTPDRDRFIRERSALLHWCSPTAVDLLDADDLRQILLLRAVGDVPGGGNKPPDHERRVALVLKELHVDAPGHLPDVPLLTDFYQTELVPRIARRAASLPHPIPTATAEAVLSLCAKLIADHDGQALLHSDLYAENIPFDEYSRPVFIDPLAHIGDPAFDWAFWAVYYTPKAGFEQRLALCAQHAPCSLERVIEWAATLALDGALFYIGTNDERAGEMQRILSTDIIRTALSSYDSRIG